MNERYCIQFDSPDHTGPCILTQILFSPEPGWYFVQTFDAIAGAEHSQELVPIEAMRHWCFFDTREDMKHYIQHVWAPREEARAHQRESQSTN